MKKVYYENVGHRYRPVSEYDSDLMSSMPKGNHLIMCYPGGASTRYHVDPAYAPMIAAGRVAQDAISAALYADSEARPKERPITTRQRAAWEEMKAAFGDELFSLTFSSCRDLAQAGVDAMQSEANRLIKHPAVRDAYEQFQLVCKLTKEKQDAQK